ncbi:nitrite/sulfite reductase [bacterium]|nr:nitrite/sulfite reductase [bacterium]
MTWKEALAGRVPPEMARDIDDFEAELARARQGRSDPAVFTETLRRRGVYGQRYDHGRRHNGVESRAIPYPHLFKGKGIYWDAPGMQRIKLPFGALTCGQMEVIADLAEEYADGIAHVTTRQDIQLHYVHLDDTPDLMRRLAAVGATTQEACGNTVRNVTGCPRAGVCPDEAFDTTPHARAVARYLLGHPDALDFGRKFKISFSGCAEHPCALARMHDIGAVAAVRQVDGETRRGFALWVGGGLGAVPHPASSCPSSCSTEPCPRSRPSCACTASTGTRARATRRA